jgi:hypothetical protein
MLTPYTLENLSPEKVKRRQSKAKAKHDEQKDSEWGSELTAQAQQVAEALHTTITTKVPNFLGGQSFKPTKWTGAVRRMLVEDNRDPQRR